MSIVGLFRNASLQYEHTCMYKCTLEIKYILHKTRSLEKICDCNEIFLSFVTRYEHSRNSKQNKRCSMRQKASMHHSV